MITTQNMVPITGAKPEMKPRKSIPANQAETSRDLEERILASPQPFTYENGAANAPTGRVNGATLGEPYGRPAESLNAKTRSMGTHVGCANTQDTNLGAVGYTKEQIEKARGYRERDSVRPGRRNK